MPLWWAVGDSGIKKPPPVVGEGRRGEVKTNELGGRLKAAKSRAMSRLIILSIFGADRIRPLRKTAVNAWGNMVKVANANA